MTEQREQRRDLAAQLGDLGLERGDYRVALLPQLFACLGNDLTHGLSHDLALVQDVGFDPTVPSIPILLLGCSSGRLQRIVVRHTIEQIFNIFAGHHQVAPVTYDTATLVASVGADRMAPRRAQDHPQCDAVDLEHRTDWNSWAWRPASDVLWIRVFHVKCRVLID